MVNLGKDIVVVSGLPRSGTSMLMRMLEAGGVPIVTDRLREADIDNPNGYYEVERVKALKKTADKSWVAEAEGKALKVVSSLLVDLPSQHTYRVVFTNRRIDEVLASQNVMRARRGDTTPGNDAELAKLYERHLAQVKAWLARQPNFSVLEVTYSDVVANPPEYARRIQAFLGCALEVDRMAESVDGQLYRNRSLAAARQ